MSVTVKIGPTVCEEPNVRYCVRNWNWKVYWKYMIAIDAKGRQWHIKVDNKTGNFFLNYCEGVTVDMEMEEIRDSYHSFIRSDFDVSKWICPPK